MSRTIAYQKRIAVIQSQAESGPSISIPTFLSPPPSSPPPSLLTCNNLKRDPPYCNAAAHALTTPNSGFPSPTTSTSTRLHALLPAEPAPRGPRAQRLGAAPARRRLARSREALALPAAVLQGAEHGAGGMVGLTMCAYVYGGAVAGGGGWQCGTLECGETV
ncbi:hypothetical protein LHYA1_G002110 [Lachnellula hyalina]|uniref:Uncharacterized protein n=1 Tax=Lachnellula hyalina TaxID=1316788 RepID=A0A8H8R773_9HELO|nr:uncharacterized protein LHYA1_G002110 [Lachnellula hyalina]TVY28866.1 hypothetical protein LHYA1_G002110 [Lachnellula hyalina]